MLLLDVILNLILNPSLKRFYSSDSGFFSSGFAFPEYAC